jgi:hypothetical protein
MSERTYVVDTPIVFKRRRKKKKGSAARRDARQTERYLVKAMRRSIKAADKGMTTYHRARNKSLRKSRDGAVNSLVPNVIKGSSATLQTLSLVPYDLLRAGYSRGARRVLRATFRSAARLSDNVLP